MAILDVWQDVWADVWQDVWGAQPLPDASFYYLLLNQTPDGSTALNTEGTVVLKNTAGQYFYAYAYTAATSTPLPGDTANLSATISKDGGSQTAVSGTIAEVSGGLYRVPAAQAETNANEIVPLWTSSTPGVVVIPVPAVVYTTISTAVPTVLESQALNPIIIGDDYASGNGYQLSFDFTPPSGATVGGSACKFGLANGGYTAQVTGSLSNNGDGTWRASFNVLEADTQSLPAGWYDWSYEVENDAGLEKTMSFGRVYLVTKQTN